MRVHLRSAAILASMMLGPAAAPAIAADEVPASSSVTAPVTAKFTVQVLGRVKNPGSVELDAGARLSDALVKAGAYSAEAAGVRPIAAVVAELTCESGGADLSSVFLTRAAAGESSKPGATYQIDVGIARRRHDLRYDPLLQQNDKIYVPECRPAVRPVRVPPIAPNDAR